MAFKFEDVVYMDVDKLEKCMKKKNLNMRQLSEEIQHNKSYIWGVINRYEGVIHKYEYGKICEVLGVNTEELKQDIKMVDYKNLRLKISKLQGCKGTYKEAISDVLELLDKIV